MNYSILDFVVLIKNASMAKRKAVSTPYAKIKEEIGKVLVKNGFLENVKKEVKDGKQTLTAVIKYEDRKPSITGILIVSKPSLKVYKKKTNVLKEQRWGTGICILSTNKGIITAREAKSQGVGGELLFKIW